MPDNSAERVPFISAILKMADFFVIFFAITILDFRIQNVYIEDNKYHSLGQV